MSTKAQRAWRLIEHAARLAKTRAGKNRCDEVRLAIGYAEPGYGSGNDVIALGNWNNCDRYDRETQQRETTDEIPSRLCAALGKMGVEIEWSDEWAECAECGKLVRTSGDSYSWTPSFQETDDGLVCVDCVGEDPSDYLESLEGNPSAAMTIRGIDATEHGYTKIGEDYEHGFHPGQDADPKLIAEALESNGIERFLFVIEDQGQFDTKFAVYVHDSTFEDNAFTAEGLAAYLDRCKTDGPSVSGALERGLREASTKMDRLQGEGIKVASINPDGTADVRLVSREDFAYGLRKAPLR